MTQTRTTPFHGPLFELFARQTGNVQVTLTDLLRTVLLPSDRALPVPPADDRSLWGGGAADPTTLRSLVSKAEADLGTPWPQPLASAAARVHRDGDRTRGIVRVRQDVMAADDPLRNESGPM